MIVPILLGIFENMYESFSFSVSNCQVIFTEMHISENPILGCFGVKVFFGVVLHK